ncbi:MAG TPA: lysin, partial [Nostoc sp.]|nr:lysin [Nostoc sp.]
MTKLPTPGLILIKEFEGCNLHAYPDPRTGGKPITIGWGATKTLN